MRQIHCICRRLVIMEIRTSKLVQLAKCEDNALLQQRKQEARLELRRNIITGAVLRSLHKKQGTMAYLLEVIEPYLKKSDRKLFGLVS
jgi:hypothetical protein